MDSTGWVCCRAALRGLHVAATFGLFGTIFLSATLLHGRETPGLRRLAWGSLALALLAGAGWFVVQTGYFASAQSFTDIWNAIPIVAQDTRFGALLLGRCAALAVAVLLLQTGWPRLALVPAAGAVVAESWLGHGGAMTGTIGTELLIASIAHLLAGAAWLGALPALRLGLKNLDVAAAQRLAQKFSPIGMVCVGVMMLTAAVQYVLLIGRPAALLNSAYGLTASVKILLLAGLMILAGFNRTRFTPGLPATRTQLLRSINVEIALGLLALLAAGLILQLQPPAMGSMGE